MINKFPLRKKNYFKTFKACRSFLLPNERLAIYKNAPDKSNPQE